MRVSPASCKGAEPYAGLAGSKVQCDSQGVGRGSGEYVSVAPLPMLIPL